MVPFSEIERLRKKERASLYIETCRQIGLVLTWVLVNLFPSLSANAVTVSMLAINLITVPILFHATIQNGLGLLFASILLFNFSICLDCVDGNIARYKRQQSVYGVFLDRLTHNVSYPLLYFSTGLALFLRTNSVMWFLSFFITGILTELSPAMLALENTENLFFQQLVSRRTQIYAVEDYNIGSTVEEDCSCTNITNNKQCSFHMREILSLFPFWNRLFFALFLDFVFPFPEYLITKLHVVLFGIRLLVRQGSSVRSRVSTIEGKLSRVDKDA